MCRWIAYLGDKIFLDELVTKPSHSLVEQSIEAEMHFRADGSLWAMNGDGFGIGWYNKRHDEPGIFKDAQPAWNDQNLHEICRQTEAYIFFGHIRASTNGKVQRSNSHPFKYKNWLFQHNGDVNHFSELKRTLQYEIRTDLYPQIEGTTDSETCFYLALTHGLEANPKAAIEKMINQIEQAQRDAGLDVGVNLSCAVTDGEKIYTIRYASGDEVIKSQFYSKDRSCLEDMGDDAATLPENGVIIVSEPLDRDSDKWIEVPENSFVTIFNGDVSVEQLNIK